MFENLNKDILDKGGFRIDPNARPTTRDLAIGAATMLLRLTYVDSSSDSVEHSAIIDTLQNNFGLDAAQTQEVFNMAVILMEKQPRLELFIDMFNGHCNETERRTVVAMAWKVVTADGRVDEFEDRFAKDITSLLRLDENDLKEAKAMAESGQV